MLTLSAELIHLHLNNWMQLWINPKLKWEGVHLPNIGETLHAKEIIQRLGDGTLDIGISGLDLLNESQKNLRDKINIKQQDSR